MGMENLGGEEVRGGPKDEPVEVVQNPKSGGQFSRPAFQLLCGVPVLSVSSHLEASNRSLPNPSPTQLALKGPR